MSKTQKKRFSLALLVFMIFLASIGFFLLLAYIIQDKNIALFNPKGLIAQEQHSLMTYTVALLLTIAIPTLTLFFYTAWKYRESNTKATHTPVATRSKFVVICMWLTPAVFIISLAFVMWPATHRLEPRKTIAADAKPITIQVVALRWKWLFIYPEQKIATVNFVQIPVNTPVTFELTADEAPMNSFWVPNLGGQLYAMTGHVNSLNLIADTPGDYPGKSAEINGRGFSGMLFTARASSVGDFEKWVEEVKKSPDTLDATKYKDLLKPSENNPVTLYSTFENNLYYNAVMKYSGPTEGHGHH